MTGCVQDIDYDVAEREPVAILCLICRVTYVGAGVQDVFGACLCCQGASDRTVIGMDVGVDHKLDLHPGLVGNPQIWLDVPERVDDGAGSVPAAAEQIGNSHWIGMEELTQNHPDPPVTGYILTHSIILLNDSP
jgi:hypothetical protein